ncbi:MAG TPA: hypothetical protein VL500_00700 [Candidatus Eisenbacteria bacterium]|nr:hypothetical protein [Candidatus Eisenbacteria bacterium]
MASSNDPRRQSVEHFKRKFGRLTKIQKLLELVRYERARDGQLDPGRLPKEFFEDGAKALREMLLEDYRDEKDLERILVVARKRESKPFGAT